MYSDSTVLELVDLIYSAAGDSARWTEVLTGLAQTLQGSTATIHHQDLGSLESSFSASWNIDPAALEQYTQYYGALNVWFTHSQELNAEGSVYTSHMLYPDQLLVRTEFYNDWLRRNRMRQGAGATVFKNGRATSIVSVFNWEDTVSFGENELALLRLLLPHFQRAFQLHNRILGLEQKGEAAADTLEQIPVALIMLNGEGRVLQANKAAAGILAAQTTLKVTSRGLTAKVPSENQRLQHLIRGAIATGSGKGFDAGGTMLLTREFKRSLQVLVVPLRTKEVRIGKDAPFAVVFVTDPEREPVSEAREFGRLFGLTPAEARLAQILAAGNSLKDASEQLGLAQSTVRSQLKSTFAKTGTRRQAELVRQVLLTLPVIKPRSLAD